MTDTPIYEQLWIDREVEKFRETLPPSREVETVPLRAPSLWARLVERLRP